MVKKILIIICFITLILKFFPSPIFAADCPIPCRTDSCSSSEEEIGGTTCAVIAPYCCVRSTLWSSCMDLDTPKLQCVEVIFVRILNIILPLALVALFVMLLVGGFKYLTSGGNPKTTASAKQTLTYAFAGIILLVFAYIIFLLIQTFTGVDILHFEIPV